jgi:hypothetical protein
MKDSWQLMLCNHLVELIGEPIIGEETLQGRMESEAPSSNSESTVNIISPILRSRW